MMQVGKAVRLLANVRLVPTSDPHGEGALVEAGAEFNILNTGPIATYLAGEKGEGWLYHDEYDPDEVLRLI